MDDAAHGSTQNLAYGDLPGPLDGAVSRQPQQAHTGNADRQHRKVEEELAKPFIGTVLLVEVFIQEIIDQRSVGNDTLPFFFDGFHGGWQTSGGYFYGHEVAGLRFDAH